MATTETDYNEQYSSDAYQALDDAQPAPAVTAPEYEAPAAEAAQTAPAAAAAPEYDSGGLLSESVSDINKLTSGSGPLMRGADTRAKQAAQERGLLSSSMAIGAAEAERLGTVMPLVQQQADIRGREMLQEGQQEHEVSQLTSQQSHDIVMEGLDAATRENLVNVEQKWNQAIQQDVNLAAFWQSSIDGLMDVMNNPELSPEQQQNAMNEMVGYTDVDGTYHVGTVEAGLNFLGNLSGMSVGDGATGTNVMGATTQGGTSSIGIETYTEAFGDDPTKFPIGDPGDLSPDGKYIYKSAISSPFRSQPEGWYEVNPGPLAGMTQNADGSYSDNMGNTYDSKGNWISD